MRLLAATALAIAPLLLASHALAVTFSSPCNGETVSFDAAEAYCASQSNTLCTAAELASSKLACVKTVRVWTSDTCTSPKNASAPARIVALGAGPDKNPQCALLANAQKEIVCCSTGGGSDTSSPVASPVSASTTQQPAAGTQTTTAAPVGGSTTPAPAGGKFVPQPCNANALYSDAVSTCAAQGAQLCTEAQLQVSTKASLPCSLSTTRVWSSSACTSSKSPSAQAFSVVLGAGNDASPQCSLTAKQEHGVMCCPSSGAGTGAPVASESTSAPASSPTPVSFFEPVPCMGLSLYSVAVEACASNGGRLCTAAEMDRPKSNLVCGDGAQRAWTSTTCKNPKAPTAEAYTVVLAAGNDANEQCSQIVSQTKAVVCCTMASTDAPAAATGSTDSPSLTTTTTAPAVAGVPTTPVPKATAQPLPAGQTAAPTGQAVVTGSPSMPTGSGATQSPASGPGTKLNPPTPASSSAASGPASLGAAVAAALGLVALMSA